MKLNQFLESGSQRKILWCVATLILIVIFGQRLWLLETRFFDHDEFEHMHVAWLISKGQLPYIDFFEHHTPAMHLLLSPIFDFFEADTDPTDAQAVLIHARRIMWILSGLVLALTFWLGRTWDQWRIGLVGTVFLCCTLMFQEKTLEIRPDLLSLPCWLGCLILLLKAIQPNSWSENKKKWMMALCGFLLGTSIMATQKMLFAMPGFTLAMFFYWFSPQSPGTFQQRFILILCQFFGFLAPIFIMLGYFQLHNPAGAYTFIHYNLLLNLGWEAGFSPEEFINLLLFQNPYIVGFGLAGLLWSIYNLMSPDSIKRGDYIMVINLIGLIVGLFIIPVPWKQYYLIFLPLLGLFAARFILDMFNHLLRINPIDTFKKKGFLAKCGLFILLSGVILAWTLPETGKIGIGAIMNKIIILGVVSSSLLFVYFRRIDLAIVMVIIGVHIPLVKKLKYPYERSNLEQLAAIRYVIQNSPPDATVMDGWLGIGVFRPHAYFYWMLHEEIREVLSESQKQRLLEDLRSGEIRPYFINLDYDLTDLSPEITRFILKHYQPVGVSTLHIRKSKSG